MPSTPSDRLRIELQARGENVNSWGDTRLNDAFKRVEESVAGVLTLNITGDVVLTSSNFVADQARMGTLILTGAPAANFRVTIPGVQKTYNVINLTGRVANFGVADMGTASVRAGVLSLVVCDGSITRVIDLTLDQVRAPAATLNLNAQRITNLATATGDTDAVPRAQVTALTSGAVESANASAVSAANSRDRAIDAEEDAEEARDQAQAALADFLNRYVVGSQFPTTGNFAGRIAFAVNAGQFGVYDQNTGAFQAITLPQQATTTLAGIVRLATAAEAEAGTDPAAVITAQNAQLGAKIRSVPRTSNTQITKADKGKLFIASGTFTQTFASPPDLGDGCFFYYKNGGQGDVTIPASDGRTNWIVYPGELRLFQCDGVALRSEVITPFYKVWTASDTFIKPPSYNRFEGVVYNGGNGGGNNNGTGGLGGNFGPFHVGAASVPNSSSVTVGAGGAAATAGGQSQFIGISWANSGLVAPYSGNGGSGGGGVSAGAPADGGGSQRGGGGGGGGGATPVRSGGVSVFAGNGGNGGNSTTAAQPGSIPAGGGGGGGSGSFSAGGVGGRGQVEIWGVA